MAKSITPGFIYYSRLSEGYPPLTAFLKKSYERIISEESQQYSIREIEKEPLSFMKKVNLISKDGNPKEQAALFYFLLKNCEPSFEGKYLRDAIGIYCEENSFIRKLMARHIIQNPEKPNVIESLEMLKFFLEDKNDDSFLIERLKDSEKEVTENTRRFAIYLENYLTNANHPNKEKVLPYLTN